MNNKYTELQAEYIDPIEAENAIESEMEPRAESAQKIYVESLFNLEGPINKTAYLDILKRSKVKYQLMKTNPSYNGLFNNKNGFPQELLLYWGAN